MKRLICVFMMMLLYVLLSEAQTWDWNTKRIKTLTSKNVNADTVGKSDGSSVVRGKVEAGSLKSKATGLTIDSIGVVNDTCFVYSSGGSFALAKRLSGGGAVPGMPTLSLPANGSSTQSSPVLCQWSSVAGATKYYFNCTLNNWETTFYFDSTLTVPYVYVVGLPQGATIKWGVAAGSPTGWGTFTDDFTFYTQTGVSGITADYFIKSDGNNSLDGKSVANAWQTIAHANGILVAGDTVRIMAGVYTNDPIEPDNYGTALEPIVYANYGADVCSLYVSTDHSPILLDGKPYVHVVGIRTRVAPTNNQPSVYVNASDYFLLDKIRCFGGSTYNDPVTKGSECVIEIEDSKYGRIYRSYVDRLDSLISSDDNRGEGIVLRSGARFCILEQDTVVRVSHFAIKVNHGSWGASMFDSALPHFNIVRDCIAHDNHVNIGGTDLNWFNMYENVKTWSSGGACSYRDGMSMEWVGRGGIVRDCIFFNDSTTANGGSSLWNTFNSSATTQSWAASSYDGRFYNNLFMGKRSSGTARPQGCLETLYDASAGDTIGNDVFKNNMLVYPAPVSSYNRNLYERGPCFLWADLTLDDYFIGNQLWTGTPNDTLAKNGATGIWYKLSQMTGTIAKMHFDKNFEASPLFQDSVSLRQNRSVALLDNSPAIDKAVPLTTVSANASGTKLVSVVDAKYFHGKWGPFDGGDSVFIKRANGTVVRGVLDSSNYVTNTLYFHAPVTVVTGDSVYVGATYKSITGTYKTRFAGLRPDVGPYETGVVTAETTSYITVHPHVFMSVAEAAALQSASGTMYETAYNALIDVAEYQDYMGMSIPTVTASDPDLTWEGQTYHIHDYWTDRPADPNPDRTDYSAVQKVCNAIRDLGILWTITGTESYATRAFAILKAWCVTSSTRMNATGSLYHYQSRIELWSSLPGMIYGMDLLYNNSNWNATEKAAEIAWIDTITTETMLPDYLNYSPNNWRIWGTQFLAASGSFRNNSAVLDTVWTRFHQIVNEQIYGVSGEAPGLMPLELERSNSLDYSLFALSAAMGIAHIADRQNISLWEYVGTDGQSLKMAMDALAPYLLTPSSWSYPQSPAFTSNSARDNGYQEYELALLKYTTNQDYLDIMSLYGRPAYDIRTTGPVTLTHRWNIP
jgi:hypothetical protein